MESYKLLRDLIKFNTIQDKENKKIIEYLEKFLQNLGFRTEYKGKYLICSIGKQFKLGFLGHTDTVEYIDEWKIDPFELTKIENKLYGLGTCDMKGGIAAMLEAISKVNLNKLKYGMKLYFTYDEEISFNGVYDILKTKEEFPDIMIFGEPTNNKILNGSKGLLEYEVYFKGIKAHSSNPEKGKSAILNAVKFSYELEEFYEKEIKPLKNKNYEIPYTTMNIGLIRGESARNSIPANCYLTLDFRIIDNEHTNEIKEKVEELSKKYECSAKIIESIESFINETDSNDIAETANFITEASFLKNVHKKIILGPGPVTAHEVNEYITEESYKKLVEQYKEIILKICS